MSSSHQLKPNRKNFAAQFQCARYMPGGIANLQRVLTDLTKDTDTLIATLISSNADVDSIVEEIEREIRDAEQEAHRIIFEIDRKGIKPSERVVHPEYHKNACCEWDEAVAKLKGAVETILQQHDASIFEKIQFAKSIRDQSNQSNEFAKSTLDSCYATIVKLK